MSKCAGLSTISLLGFLCACGDSGPDDSWRDPARIDEFVAARMIFFSQTWRMTTWPYLYSDARLFELISCEDAEETSIMSAERVFDRAFEEDPWWESQRSNFVVPPNRSDEAGWESDFLTWCLTEKEWMIARGLGPYIRVTEPEIPWYRYHFPVIWPKDAVMPPRTRYLTIDGERRRDMAIEDFRALLDRAKAWLDRPKFEQAYEAYEEAVEAGERAAAWLRLVSTGDERVCDLLIEKAQDPDGVVAWGAVWALGFIECEEWRTVLEHAALHEDFQVRLEAVGVARRHGGIGILRRLVEDEEQRVRGAAERAIELLE